MSDFRRVIVGICVLLLAVTALWGVGAVAFNQTLGNQAAVERWLADDNFYDTAANTAVTEATRSTITVGGQEVSLDRPEVRVALEHNLTPAYVEATAREVLNGSYAWLSGRTDRPHYSIDLAPIKESVIAALDDSARTHMADLPPCSLGNLPTTVDPLTIGCQPSTLIKEAQLLFFRQQLANDPDFLPETTITADTTLKTEGITDKAAQDSEAYSEPWYQRVNGLRTAYRWSQWAPWITAVAAIALAAAIVFAARTRRQGIRIVAITILVVGLLLAAVGGLGWLIANNLSFSIDPAAPMAALQTAGITFARSALRAFSQIKLWGGLGLVAAGIIGLIILAATRPKPPAPEPKAPTPKTSKPSGRKTPAKKSVKVQ